jgi:cytochrome c peroxidase
MNFRRGLLWLAGGLCALGAAAWLSGRVPVGERTGSPAASARARNPSPAPRREALLPLPPAPALPPDKVALGRRLFVDKRLSRDNSVACATCHDPARGGVDRLPVSVGVGGQRGAVNAPTVFNAALNFAQFWDGRADSLEDQVAGPVLNPVEMASNWAEVIAKLDQDDGYRADFARLFPGQGISAETIAAAIATFERTLLTPDSRFDRFLRGDPTVLSPTELEGYRRFVSYGCAACHQGANVGGNMYQRFGAVGSRPQTLPMRPADLGRFNVTHREQDRHVFKVPSLRNVAVTGPYFHDGHIASLDEAVALMGRAQLGRELSSADVQLIVAFLGTLTGECDGRPLR